MAEDLILALICICTKWILNTLLGDDHQRKLQPSSVPPSSLLSRKLNLTGFRFDVAIRSSLHCWFSLQGEFVDGALTDHHRRTDLSLHWPFSSGRIYIYIGYRKIAVETSSNAPVKLIGRLPTEKKGFVETPRFHPFAYIAPNVHEFVCYFLKSL